MTNKNLEETCRIWEKRVNYLLASVGAKIVNLRLTAKQWLIIERALLRLNLREWAKIACEIAKLHRAYQERLNHPQEFGDLPAEDKKVLL